MADETPTVTTPAAEPVKAAEPTLEEQLTALSEASTPAAATVPPAPEALNEPAIDEQLKAIPDPEAVPEAPKLTAEQEQILRIIPSAQAAQAISEQVNGYNQFTGAFERGDYQAVEQMFTNWNPDAYNGFLEHVYAQKVASGEWVDRWIADKEGNPTVHRGMTALQSRIAQLESQIQKQQQERQTVEQSTRQQQTATAYVKHLDGLFDQIKFSPADRRWVTADIHNRVSADANVRAAINNGNPAAVNSLFKSAVRDYVQRDKAAAAGQQAVLAAQEQKKPLVSTSPVTSLGALPSDIKQVPKGKEDDWMDQELANLAASVRRK